MISNCISGVNVLKKLYEYRRLYFRRRSRRGSASKTAGYVFFEPKIAPSLKAVSPMPVSEATIYTNGVLRHVRLKAVPKPIPTRLSLRDNWDQTVNFLNEVRRTLSNGIEFPENRYKLKLDRKTRRSATLNINSYYDFTHIESISIPVALILASEYDRVRKIIDWAPFAINFDRWNPAVKSMLSDIGFLELAGVDSPTCDIIEAGSMKLLRLRCGDTVDGEAVGTYLSALGIDLTTRDARLYDAIVEAISNIVHHAYKNKELLEQNSVPNWWLVAAVTVASDHAINLKIVVYDQGASIPRTLPSWERYPVWKRMFERVKPILGGASNLDPDNQSYDGDAIRIALEVGRTSTKEGHRGKGLAQIIEALELCDSGSVAIYSRSGEFRQIKGEPSVSVNRNQAMVGTLVYWDLNIGQ